MSSSPGSPTSVSSSGFLSHQPPSPGSGGPNKGKGKAVAAQDNFGVEFEAVSVQELMDKQNKAVKGLEEMLGLKVSPRFEAYGSALLAVAESFSSMS